MNVRPLLKKEKVAREKVANANSCKSPKNAINIHDGQQDVTDNVVELDHE